MWVLVGIVVVAAVLMWLAGRQRGSDGASRVDGLGDDGLVVGGNVVPWSAVYEVRVVTRRELFRTWFGFEVRCEGEGLLSVDGGSGRGELFLANAHRLAGFDHDAVREALTLRKSGVVCYNR